MHQNDVTPRPASRSAFPTPRRALRIRYAFAA